MGTIRMNLAERKAQRRTLVVQGTWLLWAGYSPSGREVVAGKARQARSRANEKIDNGSRMRSARDSHTNQSEPPSFRATYIWRRPSGPARNTDGEAWASTYPSVSDFMADKCWAFSSSQRSVWPGSRQ